MASRARPSPKPPEEVLAQREFTGHIARVTFENDEGSFKVVTFETEEEKRFKAAGNFMGARPGETMRIRGAWKEHPKHGWTFNADSWQPVELAGENALIAYLGSGMIKGVGPATARKVVEHFGDTTLHVLDETPELLANVPGLNRKLARRIAEEWSAHQSQREAMLFLKGHGLTNAMALRLMRFYGDRVIAVIRTNPYQAGLDVPRVGFTKADEIAEKMGIARDSPERIQAAFVHLLDRASTEGHTFLPHEQLIERAEQMLSVERARIEGCLEEAVAKRYLARVPVGDEQRCYFMFAMHASETGAAELILELVRQGKPVVGGDLEKGMLAFENRFRFQLAPQQKEAIRSACAGGVCVITGGPGTGKTTLVRALIHLVKNAKVRFALCSPTGRAAQRLSETTGEEAATVHRLLKWNTQTGHFTHGPDEPLELDLLIVDEASMLDVPLAFALLRSIVPGATVVFVGDVDQLPSVGPGTFLRDLIESGRVRTTRLQVVFRQAEESLIIANSHRINTGVGLRMDKDAKDADFFFVEREEKEDIREAMLAMATDRIPRRLNVDPVEGVQILTPMRRGELGVIELNKLLQERLNPDGEPLGGGFDFRRGDKVIQNSNNYDLDVYNGDVGRILGVHPETRHVQVRFGKRTVSYPPENVEELDLAYAITIHKSQGSEYPATIVLIHTTHYIMLKRNLLYTAVTRGKQLVVVIGNKRALQTAIRNSTESDRMTALRYWLTHPPEKDRFL